MIIITKIINLKKKKLKKRNKQDNYLITYVMYDIEQDYVSIKTFRESILEKYCS